ncbi:hypothetical protein [Paenibacillus wynnii]|uniref:hypothetical protein n=1 Tax=Paenibacillus wynnii TaxID=268407 RepID=UPI002790F890|nr:hypothetical protein [Paenibacillus wynnii]MDQ0193748.1 acyl carrier protein [Paenibacillus wynnii]
MESLIDIQAKVVVGLEKVLQEKGQHRQIEVNTDLLDRGLLDSFALMHALVLFESIFNIQFDDFELLLENFRTPEIIAVRIQSKLIGN